MRIKRKPGEQLEVDWAGQTMNLIDNLTGEDIPADFLGEKVSKYHKTLTTYLNGLIHGGFELTGIVEPQLSEYLLHTVKGMEDEPRRLMMLIVSAKKK